MFTNVFVDNDSNNLHKTYGNIKYIGEIVISTIAKVLLKTVAKQLNCLQLVFVLIQPARVDLKML